jgi:hypothetical protein
LSHLPGPGNPEVWLSMALSHVELGHNVKLDRADMWRNSSHMRPLRGGGLKGLVRIVPEISSFKLIVLLLQLGVVRPYLIHDTYFLSHLSLEET